MDPLITAANLLYICAYFVRDALKLRVLTLVAACFLVGYFLSRPVPLLAPVYWNLFFICINTGWVLRLLWERGWLRVARRRVQAAPNRAPGLDPAPAPVAAEEGLGRPWPLHPGPALASLDVRSLTAFRTDSPEVPHAAACLPHHPGRGGPRPRPSLL